MKRPPAPGIRFEIDAWVPLEKLTETERQKYFAEKTRRDEARKAEQGTTSDIVLNADHQLGKLQPDLIEMDGRAVLEASMGEIPTLGSSSEADQIPATQYHPAAEEDSEASEPSAKRRRMQESIENESSKAQLVTMNDAGAVGRTASDSFQFPSWSENEDTTLRPTPQLPNADKNADEANDQAELPATQSSSAMLATSSDLGSKRTQDMCQQDLEHSSPQQDQDRPAKRLRLDESSEMKPSHESQNEHKLTETEKPPTTDTAPAGE